MKSCSKVPQNAENLNPMKYIPCEEAVYLFLYLLGMQSTSRNACQMFCPKLTCILQWTSNIGLLVRFQTLDLFEDGIILQVANIPLQLLPHQLKAGKENVFMMDQRINEKLLVFTPLLICQEVRE